MHAAKAPKPIAIFFPNVGVGGGGGGVGNPQIEFDAPLAQDVVIV